MFKMKSLQMGIGPIKEKGGSVVNILESVDLNINSKEKPIDKYKPCFETDPIKNPEAKE